MLLECLNAVQRRLWGTELKALARSRNMTWRSIPSFLAVWICCQIMLVCSKHPAKSGIPAFSTDQHRYIHVLFFFAEAGSLSPKKILKKIFPSTLRSYVVMWWNWLMSVESFSFEIGMPLALLQAVGISRFCHTTYICLHKKLRTSGTLL